jgi:hypothetical protein
MFRCDAVLGVIPTGDDGAVDVSLDSPQGEPTCTLELSTITTGAFLAPLMTASA